MEYYKVIDERILKSVHINTETINYALTLNNFDTYSGIIEFMIESSKEDSLPFDFYDKVNNHCAIWGGMDVQYFSKQKNGSFEISDITKKEHHKGIFISEYRMKQIIEHFAVNESQILHEGYYLWEQIFEEVRFTKHPDKPKRSESFFLFENIDDCNYYIEKHKGGGLICRVQLIETKANFRADMNLLDDIPENTTYIEASVKADNYWLGEVSDKPVFENIFQGECVLIPAPEISQRSPFF